MLGDTKLQSSFVEMDLGALVYTNLNMSHPCALVAKDIITLASLDKVLLAEFVGSPLYSALMRSDLENCPVLGFQTRTYGRESNEKP